MKTNIEYFAEELDREPKQIQVWLDMIAKAVPDKTAASVMCDIIAKFLQREFDCDSANSLRTLAEVLDNPNVEYEKYEISLERELALTTIFGCV